MPAKTPAMEWPTLLLLLGTYGVWALATSVLVGFSLLLAILVTGLAIAQFSSLQHEVLHGHPTRWPLLNEGLATPALSLVIPFRRFRDTHLAHHFDPALTDPYDDPETNYLDPAVWNRLPPVLRRVLAFNNTLLGRVLVGPFIGTAIWLAQDLRLALRGDRAVTRAWGLHLAGLVPVVLWLGWAAMPWWGYLLACWIGLGLLKIRTFVEHRAHELARARTVVIEDRGPLALLYLNNNLHAVHHMHPQVPWYALPAMYRANRTHYLRRNGGYVYRSYGEVIRSFLFRAKDPVPHPIWTSGSAQAAKHRPVAPVVEEGNARSLLAAVE